MIFYLGVPEPAWLERMAVPAFVSRNRLLRARDKLPVARVPWAMDSGGFTEVTQHGGWRVTAREFATEVGFYAQAIGNLEFCAPMDWMTEPVATCATGLTVREHQRRTTTNLIELRTIAPWLPWIPVLQGQSVADYLRHVEDYEKAGFALAREPRIGVGSICRRQGSREAVEILTRLAGLGLRLHGFGLSTQGLRGACGAVASADSMAWSAAARHTHVLLPGHDHRSYRSRARGAPAPPNDCRNCLGWAVAWRRTMLGSLPSGCVDAHPRVAAGVDARHRGYRPAPPRARGELTALELAKALVEAKYVVAANGLLAAEEEVEAERGSTFGDVPVPATLRAVLSPEGRARLAALTPGERGRLGAHAATVVEALAYDESGPLWAEVLRATGDAAPAVVAAVCTPSSAGKLLSLRGHQKRRELLRRVRTRFGCTLAEAPHVLRWGPEWRTRAKTSRSRKV